MRRLGKKKRMGWSEAVSSQKRKEKFRNWESQFDKKMGENETIKKLANQKPTAASTATSRTS